MSFVCNWFSLLPIIETFATGSSFCTTEGVAEWCNCSRVLLESAHIIAGHADNNACCSVCRACRFPVSHSPCRKIIFGILIRHCIQFIGCFRAEKFRIMSPVAMAVLFGVIAKNRGGEVVVVWRRC